MDRLFKSDGAISRAVMNDISVQRYLKVCLKALGWAEKRNYTGYSKFDALNSPLLKRLAGNRRILRGGFTYMVSRAPFNVRPLLGVEQRQNPNGLALFAGTHFNLYRFTGNRSYLDKGLALLQRLLELSQCARYAGHCWGYDHDWEMGKFFIAQYEPNTVVTVFVAQAFMSAYQLTSNKAFLDVANSSTRFLRENLNVTLDKGGMKSYSYTPFDRWTALNISALIAGLFASVFAVTGESELADETTLLVNFLLNRQTDDGAWYHGDPPQASHRKIDNYHIAFILESLLHVYNVFGNKGVQRAYERGLNFYNTHLFLDDGAPKFQSHQVYPHDTVACSQGIITFAHAARFNSSWLTNAKRIANWTLQHMWHPDGRFYFQKSRLFIKQYTLMRWCQAWMCYALSELVMAYSGSSTATSREVDTD